MKNQSSIRKMSPDEAIYYKKLGETLRALIKAKGYTQLEFALKAGVSYSMLLNHLQGTRKLNLYKYRKICEALEIDSIELMSTVIPDIYVENKTKLYMNLFSKISTLSNEELQKIIDSIKL